MTPEVARVLRFCRVLASQAGSADDCRYPLQPKRRRSDRTTTEPPTPAKAKAAAAVPRSAAKSPWRPRPAGQWLSERLGQPFVVENRPGAATDITTEAAVRAPANGYTLLLVTASNAINATLYDKLGFNFTRDIMPVGSIGRVSNVMLIHPSFPTKILPEFISYGKANPGKVNMASAGNGRPSHSAGELSK
jgi:Tripartite tricarboxylate transporter family receptor